MRIRYRYARSLLAGFLAVVLLFSLVPAASAAQQNSYHDPAENWKEALDRTNELDANAVVTHETFDCAYAALLAEKKEAYAELRKARDEAQELLIVKANVDRILQNTERGGNAQEKGTVSFAANCALY